MDWLEHLKAYPRVLPVAERLARGGATLLAALRRYHETERFSAEEIAGQQRELLGALAAHAAAESPYFARRLQSAQLRPADLAEPGGLSRLPPFSRQELSAAGEDLFCRRVPPSHGGLLTGTTSGSTGEPITVRGTQACRLHWEAHTFREHLWHRRDFSAGLAIVRAQTFALTREPNWGSPCAKVLETGAGLGLPATLSLEEIFRHLAEFEPGYLLILPSVLAGLLEICERTQQRLPSLRGVRTLSETVSPNLRETARRCLGLEIHDIYSSQEGGVMAMQCPEQGSYHVVESTLLEVVDPQGNPCAPGEIGRLLLTDLVNYATPLVRYEIGDWAEAGSPCACGRGLPTIQRLLGRERNLVLLPDGSRHWPLFGFHRWGEVCPIRQFQFTQIDRRTIAARFHVQSAPSPAQTTALTAIIQDALGHPFEIACEWHLEPLARGPGGKFEEFVCLAR